MKLVAKGFSNEQIEKKLHITLATLKTHLANVYQKYCVNVEIKNRKPAVTRLRASLIYLGLARIEDFE